MLRADVTDGSGTRLIANDYDADGIRARQSVTTGLNTTDTTFLIDANRPFAQVLEEWTSLNAQPATLNVSHTYGPHAPISQNRSGFISYYHGDHLNTTRTLTDANGALTDGYNYDAFGRILQQTGPTANSYLYTGEQRDPNVNLDYLRARYLNFNAGRFYGRDTVDGQLECPNKLHRYGYSGNDPVGNVDPAGEFAIAIATVAVANALYRDDTSRGRQVFITPGKVLYIYDPLQRMEIRDNIPSCFGAFRFKSSSLGSGTSQPYSVHQGWDLLAAQNTPVRAVGSGTVVWAKPDTGNGYGKEVLLSFNDRSGRLLFAHYAHLNSYSVVIGQPVKAGANIGATGRTGYESLDDNAQNNHLHFEIRTTSHAGTGLAGRVDPAEVLGYSWFNADFSSGQVSLPSSDTD